jgi:hypothetical protein
MSQIRALPTRTPPSLLEQFASARADFSVELFLPLSRTLPPRAKKAMCRVHVGVLNFISYRAAFGKDVEKIQFSEEWLLCTVAHRGGESGAASRAEVSSQRS